MVCVDCAESPTGHCGMHKARGTDDAVRPLGSGAGKFGRFGDNPMTDEIRRELARDREA